jgi:hypothetical protein
MTLGIVLLLSLDTVIAADPPNEQHLNAVNVSAPLLVLNKAAWDDEFPAMVEQDTTDDKGQRTVTVRETIYHYPAPPPLPSSLSVPTLPPSPPPANIFTTLKWTLAPALRALLRVVPFLYRSLLAILYGLYYVVYVVLATLIDYILLPILSPFRALGNFFVVSPILQIYEFNASIAPLWYAIAFALAAGLSLGSIAGLVTANSMRDWIESVIVYGSKFRKGEEEGRVKWEEVKGKMRARMEGEEVRGNGRSREREWERY